MTTVVVSPAPAAWKHASAHFHSRPDVKRFLVGDGRRRCGRPHASRVRPDRRAHVRCGEFLNNRYLDSSTGVFLSVDPLVGMTGYPYLYGNGNPVTFSDPTGLAVDPLDWILQFVFSNYFEGIVVQHALGMYGGGEDWQTQVVIHGARDGGQKDGRANAVNFDSGGLVEFKGVSGLQSERSQLRTA